MVLHREARSQGIRDPSDRYLLLAPDKIKCDAMGDNLGNNCIQNIHLRRYIVSYTVGNFVLRQRVSGAVKRNFRPYNR